jgi:hypothetical protein
MRTIFFGEVGIPCFVGNFPFFAFVGDFNLFGLTPNPHYPRAKNGVWVRSVARTRAMPPFGGGVLFICRDIALLTSLQLDTLAGTQ